MAGEDGTVGRDIDFYWNGARVSGVREKGIKLDGSAIDVTADEDDGWQKLLTVAGENKIEVSISGVTKVPTLRDAWFSGNRTKTVSIGWVDGKEMSGTFFLASYSEKGTYKDATTFEATLQSSGQPTYAAYS